MKHPTNHYHRGTQVVRQWRIIRLLINAPDGLTVPEIAEAINARLRTTYRDIAALDEAGFPLTWQPGAGRHGDRWGIAASEMTERERQFFKTVDPDM